MTAYLYKAKMQIVQVISHEDTKVVCKFDHHKYTASEIIRELSEEFAITDLSVEEPDIEEAVAQIYHE